VAQLTRDAAFLPGEVIMREGEPGGELYLLLEGRAEAWLDYEGPNRKRLGEIGKGEYMGEIAILDNEPRSASVVVVEQARALVLDGDSLKALVMQMPESAFELLRVMTARVRASERRLLESGK
jgi:CRP/FNR family cyclic AMP-dependent transcriptional regulator